MTTINNCNESPLARAIAKARGDINTDEDIKANIDFLNNAAGKIKSFSDAREQSDSLQLLIEFREHLNRRISELSSPLSPPELEVTPAGEQGEKPLELTWGENRNREPEQVHVEWHAPCGCAFHPKPFPHVHPCSTEHIRPDLHSPPSFVCTECPHIFTEAELAAEDKAAWGHPCHANVTDRFGPVPTACESFRKPLAEETENERVLRRRRAFMPDYDKALEEWLS